MRRRGPGIGGLQRKLDVQSRFESLGHDIGQASVAAVEKQLEMFQKNLQDFAIKHKDKINRNPVFRAQFQKMCATIGVDPLASTKSFWTQTLGVGEFYYELAVQCIEICIMTRPQNGGMIALDDLVGRLRARRKAIAARANADEAALDISTDDVRRAIKSVSVLGNGFKLVEMAGHTFCLSVPLELRKERVAVLELAGLLTPEERRRRFGSIMLNSSLISPGGSKVASTLATSSTAAGGTVGAAGQGGVNRQTADVDVEEGEDGFLVVVSEPIQTSSTPVSPLATMSVTSAPDAPSNAQRAKGEQLAAELRMHLHGGWLTVDDIVRILGWIPDRAESVLSELLREGVCWIDDQLPQHDATAAISPRTTKSQARYFFTSVWLQHKIKPEARSPSGQSSTSNPAGDDTAIDE